jgi:hypothetical protein
MRGHDTGETALTSRPGGTARSVPIALRDLLLDRTCRVWVRSCPSGHLVPAWPDGTRTSLSGHYHLDWQPR